MTTTKHKIFVSAYACEPGPGSEIGRIGEMMGYLGLRCYFFYYDNIKDKATNIQENLCKVNNKNLLVKTAQKVPALFSFISNLCSPFGNLAMYIYRNVKYKL